MKTQLLLIFSFFLTFLAEAQTGSGKILEDSLCYKIWLVDNKMGGYDGFEFRKNGELKLLNYDGFVREKWWTKGDHLFVEIRSTDNGKVLKTDYQIKKHTADQLVLSYTSLDVLFTDVYASQTSGDFTDRLLGHWDGENGTYIQIVPKSSFQFQLVTSRGPGQIPDRADGFLDKENSRIIFYPEEDDGKESSLFFNAGMKTITIGGKSYSRKCR